MNNYMCANRHLFRAPEPVCPRPDCTAEVRPTSVSPMSDAPMPNFNRLDPLPESEVLHGGAQRGGKTHTIRWHAYVDGQRTRRTSAMKDGDYAWDATCSCGWDSGTGGATYKSVNDAVQVHKLL